MTLNVTPIDHIVDGTSHVISQYHGKPLFLSRLACYLNMIQHVEDQLPLIHGAFRPDTSTGFRLDWVGAKVGQRRIGATDDIYRLYVKARIVANRSEGKIQDLEAIAALLLADWGYHEVPLAIMLETSDELTTDEATAIQGLMQRAAPTGVPVFLISATDDPTFTFDAVSDSHDVDGGFDTVAGSTGPGFWARVTP